MLTPPIRPETVVWLSLRVLAAGEPIDPDVPSATPLQKGAAMFAALVGGLITVYVWWRLRRPSLDGDDRETHQRIKSRLESLRTRSLVIEKGDDLDEYREPLREMGRGNVERLDEVQPLARSEFRRLLGSVRAAWTRAKPNVPRLSMWLTYEGVATLVFGSIATVAIVAWEDASETGGLAPSVATVLDAFGTVVDLLVSALFAFPLAELWAALGLAYVLQLGKAIYHAWLPLGVLLLVGAALIALLDRATPRSLEVSLISDKIKVAKALTVAFAGIYLAGTLPVVLFGTLGYAQIGSVVGLAFALLASVAALVYGTFYFTQRVREIHEDLSNALDAHFPSTGWASTGPGMVAASIVSYRVFAFLGMVTLPALVAWVYRSIGSGRILKVARVFANAPLTTQGPLVSAALVLLWLFIRAGRGKWTDLRAALSRSLSKQRLRVAALARGFVVALFGGIVLVGVLLGFPLKFVFGAAFVAALVARLGYLFYSGGKYLHVERQQREDTTRTPSRVVIDVPKEPLEDAQGREIYYFSLNGHKIAWPEVDQAVERCLKDSKSIFVDGEAPPSVESYYLDQLREYGVSDPARARRKLRGEIRTSIESAARSNADRDASIRELKEEYDPEIVEDMVEYMEDEVEEIVNEAGVWRFRRGSPRAT